MAVKKIAQRAPTRAELREIRLQEIRAKAKVDGNLDALFPTAAPDVTTPEPGTVHQFPGAPPAEQQVAIVEPAPEQGRLAALAFEINVRFMKAERADRDGNDHRLSAAMQLAEARKECESRKINFRAWAEASIPQTFQYVRDLANVGASEDPIKALADLRQKSVLANRKLRERRRIETTALKQLAGTTKEQQIETVLAGLKDGSTVADIARQMGVSRQTVMRLRDMGRPEETEVEQPREPTLEPEVVQVEEIASRLMIAEKAAKALPAEAARVHVLNVAKVLGLEIVRDGSTNFHVTVDSLLNDFSRLSADERMEFMTRAETVLLSAAE